MYARIAKTFADNHKPAQTSESRTTKLTSASSNTYNLKVEDRTGSREKDIFTFTGNRVAPKKSYVLLFDPASQKATLEPLSDAYTFNIATKNDKNISSEYSKIYPKKNKESQQDDEGDGDLFGEVVADDESGDPDSNNPYDFRHFLDKEKEKRSDDSEYHASSPEYRTGTGSAMNTPQFGARKTAETTVAKAKAAEPVQKKRKTADPFMKKKTGVKKAQPTPAIHLERKATERPPPAAAPKAKAAAPPSSKIKSAELVHSSDESDADAEGELEPVSSPPRQIRRSPSPQYHASPDAEDEDAEGESDDDGGFEIEIPDARPSRPQNNAGGSLKNLGLGQNLGLGGRGFKSPSQGPISLASAASSAHGSPNAQAFTSRKSREDDNVIDFGDIEEDAEGEDDEDEDEGGYELEIDEGEGEGDRDVEVIDIGPPARQGTSGHERKQSIGGPAAGGAAAEDDEEDPLYQEMMAGLAGDSSEESEEE